MLKSAIIWDITPCIPLKVNRTFKQQAALLATYFMLVSCSPYF
jgi:hypothetical protein